MAVIWGSALSEYAVRIPTTPILILRFPDGDVEHRTTRGELPVGTVLRSRGALWRVREYDGTAAFLEEAEPQPGPAGSPVITADPIGDMPLTFEILTEV